MQIRQTCYPLYLRFFLSTITSGIWGSPSLGRQGIKVGQVNNLRSQSSYYKVGQSDGAFTLLDTDTDTDSDGVNAPLEVIEVLEYTTIALPTSSQYPVTRVTKYLSFQ